MPSFIVLKSFSESELSIFGRARPFVGSRSRQLGLFIDFYCNRTKDHSLSAKCHGG